MTASHTTYTVRHLEIEGEIIDRETGYPDLHAEMQPTGVARPVEEQGRQLVLRIGKIETRLRDEGIQALRAFLDG